MQALVVGPASAFHLNYNTRTDTNSASTRKKAKLWYNEARRDVTLCLSSGCDTTQINSKYVLLSADEGTVSMAGGGEMTVSEFSSKPMDFAVKMMDFALKMSNFGRSCSFRGLPQIQTTGSQTAATARPRNTPTAETPMARCTWQRCDAVCFVYTCRHLIDLSHDCRYESGGNMGNKGRIELKSYVNAKGTHHMAAATAKSQVSNTDSLMPSIARHVYQS